MLPTEAVSRNEMSFSRDTRVTPSNIVLERTPVIATRIGDLSKLC